MEFQVRLMAAAISITFLHLILCGHVTAVSSATDCEAGQAEGDKWFDGCRWCVCENNVAVCSSSACSELNAQLPPCENVGSSWWDGCYRCTCFNEGIECTADRTCVALIKSRRFRSRMAYALSQGACIKPQDNRCVCGVDGVPSCTADAIDRNALQATTISLVPSSSAPPTSRRRNIQRTTSRRPNPHIRRPPSSLRRSRMSSRTSRYRDGPVRSYRRPRNDRRRMLRLRRSVARSLILGHTLDTHRPIHAQKATSGRRKKRCIDCSDGDGQEMKKRRETRSLVQTIPSFSDEKSPSLLVSTDNRCRWGSRWYGGGLRCYCDQTGAITCGDPRFVASRIDGFLMDRTPCYQGQEWEDPDNCRFCECHVSGVALCWRAESCPFPFLIAPVEPTEDQDVNKADDLSPINTKEPALTPDDVSSSSGIDGGLRRIASEPRNGVMSAPPEEELPGSGDDVNGMFFPREPSTLRRYQPPPRISSSGGSNSRASTTVIVRECTPGKRWRDGCLRCRCREDGKKYCTDKFCLKARAPSRPSVPLDQGSPGGGNNDGNLSTLMGRRIQIPPSYWSSQREHPLAPILTQPKNACGRFKLNEVYFIDECNQCRCLPTGPKCTALSC